MKIKNLPKKFEKLWLASTPLLKQGRNDDLEHAKETVEFILSYKGKTKIDQDILIPVAMLHDIGHSAILPEHHKFIVGPNKIKNSKLVHMLSGAKVASDLLKQVGYNKNQSKEIVDIISIHDFDQMKDLDYDKFYDTENKKTFSDIDSLDRFTETRLKNVKNLYPDRDEVYKILEEFLEFFFYDEFKNLAKSRLEELKNHNG